MDNERIRALEVHQEATLAAQNQANERLERIEHKVTGIEIGLSKQRGYIAGAMSVIVVIWSAVLGFIAAMWDKVTESFGTFWP